MRNNGRMDLFNGGEAVAFGNIDTIDEALRKEAINVHNQAIDNYTKAINSKVKGELERAKEITTKMSTMEIMPINYYVLVKPYAKNPYQKVEVTDSGLIIPEYTGDFKNPDSGEDDKEENLSVVANVIAVSPLCKFIKEGDDIYYRRVSGVPVPFFRQGFEVVAEQQIQAVINEGLTERFKNIE